MNSGPFKRNYGCKVHDSNVNPSLYLIDLRKRKNIKKKDYDYLLQNDIVLNSTHYICKTCFESCIPNTVVQSQPPSEVDEEEPDLKETELYNKSVEIAAFIETLIKEDMKEIRFESIKTFEGIIGYNPSQWLAARPHLLVNLISAFSGVDPNTASADKITLISKVIELIYACRNSKLVLPNFFIENLLCYSYTNCKSYLNFVGNRSPGGGYTHMCNWLKEQSKEPLTFPDGLAKAVFDNNQKIGKTYLITGTNKVPTSVITSHLWISLDKQNKMQTAKEFTPENWMFKEMSTEDSTNVKKLLTEPSCEFRQTRNHFIEKCLSVFNGKFDNGNFDAIDDQIKRQNDAENLRKCEICGWKSESNIRKCIECCGNMKKTEAFLTNDLVDIDPYVSFKKYESSEPQIECMAGEPDFINPNSYQSITQILQTIGTRAGVKQYGTGLREWLFIECDGLPYNLIRTLISEVLRCQECRKCFYGKDNFEDHKCFILNQATFTHEFGWLVPVFGLLHMEMNLARAFTKLNWDIFMKHVGMELGFKSLKAQQYLQKGADHHKLWHMLEVLYSALNLELLYPYVIQCKSDGIEASVDGYWNWCHKVANPNYLYMQHAFTNLHALMSLRAGDYCIPILFGDLNPIFIKLVSKFARVKLLTEINSKSFIWI